MASISRMPSVPPSMSSTFSGQGCALLQMLNRAHPDGLVGEQNIAYTQTSTCSAIFRSPVFTYNI